jgi:hypothetical protein
VCMPVSIECVHTCLLCVCEYCAAMYVHTGLLCVLGCAHGHIAYVCTCMRVHMCVHIVYVCAVSLSVTCAAMCTCVWCVYVFVCAWEYYICVCTVKAARKCACGIAHVMTRVLFAL